MSIKIYTLLICIQAAISLSGSYNVGNKVEKALQLMLEGNTEESIQHFKTAAATNDVVAQYYLGQCYETGIGVNTDYNSAFSMYRRAAERGFPPAMFDLARCYRDGIGVVQNNVRANEWMTRFEKKKFEDSLPLIKEVYNASLNNRASSVSETPTQHFSLQINSEDKAKREEMNISSTPPNLYVVNERLNCPADNNPSTISDVDSRIPTSGIIADNFFALIIANENYQDVSKVSNALNDGIIMAEYCNKIWGIPTTNIHLVKDATLNNIKREINLLKQIASAYNGEASFLIYYAGHGIPDEKTHEAFLMPVDGFISDMSTCISLAELYKILGDMPTRKNVIIMDACFSGSTRDSDMLYAARGVRLKPKNTMPNGKTIVITSSQGDETAFPYYEENHGLFTYFFLKKLKESKGNITLGELFEYVKDNVLKKSLVVNKKSQTPAAIPSNDISEEWKNWKIE